MFPITQKAKELFVAHAHCDRSRQMEQYLKGHFTFFGITTPERKALTQQLLIDSGFPPDNELEHLARELWAQPERELHYLALDLLDRRACEDSLDWLPLLEYLITHNSWWDTVDRIASRIAGAYFKIHREQARPVTDKWLRSENQWLQRTCILFQLKYKTQTDEELLYDAIRYCSHSTEFFIQKAIGWVLREYSKTNPSAVRRFIEDHPLAPLSKRVGMKWLKEQSTAEPS